MGVTAPCAQEELKGHPKWSLVNALGPHGAIMGSHEACWRPVEFHEIHGFPEISGSKESMAILCPWYSWTHHNHGFHCMGPWTRIIARIYGINGVHALHGFNILTLEAIAPYRSSHGLQRFPWDPSTTAPWASWRSQFPSSGDSLINHSIWFLVYGGDL